MTDDVFEKVQEFIDYLEAIHGSDLNDMWFNIENDNDLEKGFCKKTYRWTREIPSD